jgi:hypothetical protein
VLHRKKLISEQDAKDESEPDRNKGHCRNKSLVQLLARASEFDQTEEADKRTSG